MNLISKKIFLGSIFLTLFSLSTNISAKTCKGMSQSSCNSSTSCSWVNGYKTKSGNNVSSFCRNKAKNSNKKETVKTPKKKIKYDTVNFDKKDSKSKDKDKDPKKKSDDKK